MGTFPFYATVLPPDAISLNSLGADPTGTVFSDGAMAAALASLGTGAGIITASPGTYKFANSYTFGVGQGIATGQAKTAVLFKYTGSGTFIHSFDAAFNTSVTSPLASVCGPQTGYTIDGSGAGAGAKAFKLGDQNQPDVDIGIQAFNGAASIGGWIASVIGWINYGSVTISTNDCTNHIVFDGSGVGGGTALGGTDWAFTQTANPNQNGVVVEGVCSVIGRKFSLFGEYLGAVAANTGSVFSIGAADASSLSNFSSFDVNAECNTGAGNVGPVTVALGPTASFYANSGQLVFRNQGSGAFQASTGIQSNLSFSFFGFVRSQAAGDYLGDPFSGVGTIGWASTTSGGALEKIGVSDGSNFYVSTGNVFNFTCSAGANTRAMFGSAPTFGQRITLFITAATSSTLTITGVLTSSGAGLIGPTSVTAGFVDVVELRYNGTSWAQVAVTLHVH